MRTLVYQSFRTFDVPEWMQVCMDSAKGWASLHGYSYQLIDDSFFTYVPDWFAQAVKGQRHLVSDLARLELAHKYLSEGWDRVIWVDADVFICDPTNFVIDNKKSYLLCRELWMTSREGKTAFSERVNNSIAVFCKNNHFLDFYRSSCQAIVRHKRDKLTHTDIGTSFLSRFYDVLPLIKSSVVFSPFLLAAFYRNDKEVIKEFQQRVAVPIQAVNLCLTFRNLQFYDVLFTDDVYLAVISNLKLIVDEHR